MPVPVITQPSAQMFTVGQDFTYHVPISNAPTTVRVRGRAVGQLAYWDATNNRVVIKGHAGGETSGRTWRIEASNADGAATPVTVTYGFAKVAPVINTGVTVPTVYIGQPYKFAVPIANLPNEVTVDTELIGVAAAVTEDGGEIFTLTPPAEGLGVPAKNYTFTSGKFSLNAKTGALSASNDFNYTISDARKGILYAVDSNRFAWLNDAGPSQSRYHRIGRNQGIGFPGAKRHYLDRVGNDLYLLRSVSGNARFQFVKVAISELENLSPTFTTQNQSGSVGITFSNIAGFATDGTDFFVAHGGTLIVVYRVSNATRHKSFNLAYTPLAMTIDGNDLIIISGSASNFYIDWFNKNTANRATASATKSWTIPGGLGFTGGTFTFDLTTTSTDLLISLAQTGPGAFKANQILGLPKSLPTGRTIQSGDFTVNIQAYRGTDAIAPYNGANGVGIVPF